MKVLILGGAGFIGSVTAHLFVKSGHKVTVVDDLSTGHRDYINAKSQLVIGNICDRNLMVNLFNKPWDVVLHFAAKIRVDESVAKPAVYFQNNTLGSLNIIELATKHGIKNFIFSSSAAVYGNPKSLPVKETDQLAPLSPYGWSKLLTENLLQSYHQTRNLNWVAFRYFNAAGSYQHIGQDYPFTTHLIPSLVKAVLAGKTFEVFGGDYETKDGTAVRDYIHVEDVARAHVIAAENMLGGHQYAEPINLGTKSGSSILEIIRILEHIVGEPIAYKISARREGDSAAVFASNDRAKKLLGWSPKYDIHRIVADTYSWHKKHKN